jgi:hypothetical protein
LRKPVSSPFRIIPDGLPNRFKIEVQSKLFFGLVMPPLARKESVVATEPLFLNALARSITNEPLIINPIPRRFGMFGDGRDNGDECEGSAYIFKIESKLKDSDIAYVSNWFSDLNLSDPNPKHRPLLQEVLPCRCQVFLAREAVKPRLDSIPRRPFFCSSRFLMRVN